MNWRMTLSVTCLESLFRTNVRDNFVCVVGALNIVDFFGVHMFSLSGKYSVFAVRYRYTNL